MNDILLALAILGLIAGSIYAGWLMHEAHLEEQRRKRILMGLNPTFTPRGFEAVHRSEIMANFLGDWESYHEAPPAATGHGEETDEGFTRFDWKDPNQW